MVRGAKFMAREDQARLFRQVEQGTRQWPSLESLSGGQSDFQQKSTTLSWLVAMLCTWACNLHSGDESRAFGRQIKLSILSEKKRMSCMADLSLDKPFLLNMICT